MNRKGFTLIELLIVVVIIGILAAIAIPKFANTKAKAYIASMKSDLRNLVTAEEAYFADSVKYTATTACTTPPTAGAVNFCVTTGNNLGVVGLAAGNGGWSVTITNNNLTTPLVTCAIFINKIGRASCRERVEIAGIDGSILRQHLTSRCDLPAAQLSFHLQHMARDS